MIKLHIYIGILFLTISCKKEIGPQNVAKDKIGKGEILVLNEGNFGFGNASVSKLNPETGEIANNQYRLINGVGIGDVLQSAKQYKDKYYFVVNNSGKVVVTDTNLVLDHEITGFNSPRHIEFFGDKAFVTDLKQGAIYVVDLLSKSILSEIKTMGWTEDIYCLDSTLYVLDRGDYLTNSDSNYIYSIDPRNDIKLDSIKVGVNPNSIQLDADGHLWVLTSGASGSDFPAISQYNVSSKTLLFQYNFISGSNPTNLSFCSQNKRIYFLNNSIFSIHTNGLESAPTIFYQKQSENFYGLDVVQQKLYATNAKNYIQTGDINIFTLSGEKSNTVSSGLIPSMIIK